MHQHRIWTYTDGYLTAIRPDGSLWFRWAAEDALGQSFADLLNQSPTLSSALLPPWTI